MMFMTPHILKNLFQKSATRMYPLEQREPFERARGELAIAVEDCIFCGACARKCPSQCITVDKKTATWTLDPMACICCGICVAACPKDCLRQELVYRRPCTAREEISRQGEIRRKPKKVKPAGEEKKAA
jgi:ech hydrogenase subunit F